MEEKLKLIAKTFGEEKFKFNESLKYYTALNLEKVAKMLFVAFTTPEIIKIATMCRELGVYFFIFGTGSKLVIPEEALEGLIIKNRTRNIKIAAVKGKVGRTGIGVEEAMVEVESGVSINKLIEYLDTNNLFSQDFLGIGGTVGGSLFINSFLQTKAKSIKVLDLNSEVEEIDPSELSLRKHIILSAVFKVKSK